MASRRWTVVVIPEDGATVRQFRLSHEIARIAVAGTLLLVALASSVVTALVTRGGVEAGDPALLARNEVLQQELDYLTTRLDTLETSLDDLARKDEHYRLLAGLEPLDRDVLRAGIGGPDGDSLEASDVYRVDRRAGVRAWNASMQVSSLVRRATVLASSWSEAEGVLTEKHARLRATPSIYPTRGYLSSSYSSSRLHPILDRARPHTGIDIVAPTGTPVVATANGRVTSAGRRGEYGLLVEIDHGHGVVTRYAHLSKTAVKPGQAVQRGQNIGAVGSSGLSAGPHLHYEVLVNGRHTNPMRYILVRDVLPD